MLFLTRLSISICCPAPEPAILLDYGNLCPSGPNLPDTLYAWRLSLSWYFVADQPLDARRLTR
ncbi:hypothetical protein [Rubripirellula lacrimiformis]|uniref:hypothetical protein n=1 Tax=Rubripirellula lacrimiformis TaxID=1930273 RepID=UPI00119EEE19|nr:hypothetical protein [Rubripirellula lacrimiformis]